MLDMPVAPPRDSMPRYSCDRSPPDQKFCSNWSASRRARLMTMPLAEDDGPRHERGQDEQPDDDLHRDGRLRDQADDRQVVIHVEMGSFTRRSAMGS